MESAINCTKQAVSASITPPPRAWRIRSPLLVKKSQRRSSSDLLTTPSTWHFAHVTTANFDQPLSTLEMGCKIDPRLTASRLKRLSYRVLTKRRSGLGIWIDRARETRIERERKRKEGVSSSGGSSSQKIAATSSFVRYLDLFHAITAIRGCFNNRSLIVTHPLVRAYPGIPILSMINDAFFRVFIISMTIEFDWVSLRRLEYISMLGCFLCLAKFDFSDRIDTRIDSIRSSILNERKFIFVTWRVDANHVKIRLERWTGRIFFSSFAWNSWGLISEINSVTGVQISIVLINKQMYRRANICHEGGVDHGSRIRRLQAQV